MTTVNDNTFDGANAGVAGGYVPLTTLESAKMDADLGQVKVDLDTHLAALQAIYVKLDTIESSAKDDQSAVEIAALINASTSLIDANNLEATVALLTNVSSYIETHRTTTTAAAMHTEASIKSTGQTYSYTPTSVVTSCQNILDEINNVRAQIHKMLGQTTWIDTPGTSIATIKSKLDGIEAGATADQTAAEIRTLVGNATDSNVFTDANNSKLSGIATSANNYVHPNHSGDVTSTGDGATTIGAGKVTEAMQVLADNVTNNVSTTKHGYVPKMGTALQIIQVNADGTALEYVDNSKIYGVTWDESADTYVRTGTLAGVTKAVSPDDSLMPIQASMKRCLLKDDGALNYYVDGYNQEGIAPFETGTDDTGTASKVSDVGVFTQAAAYYVGKYVHNTTDDTYALITAKDSNDVLSIDANIFVATETFEICTAHLGAGVAAIDNPQGQVMVQIPLFYYKYGYVGTSHTWEISQHAMSGFSVHPAFIKNGAIVPYRYIGAYEGSMYDATATAMVPPANIVDNIYAAGDKLCSLSGEYPKTNETRAEYRGMAASRGTGWRQQDYDLISAVQLLYLVEYASFYSQSVIGMGRTELSAGTWTADSYIGQCGKSNGDGNGTGNIGGNTNTAYMSYRGIENFYGNVWKWVDGININAQVPYASNTDTQFADDTATNYTSLAVTLVATDGYQNTLEQISRGFLPASVGASSSTKITDYYYQNTGWRVVRLGGHAAAGAPAGAFLMNADYASSAIAVDVGGRLAF